jgi:hypothetical protein
MYFYTNLSWSFMAHNTENLSLAKLIPTPFDLAPGLIIHISY